MVDVKDVADPVAEMDAAEETLFRREMELLINKHSVENGSNTPDWILARYLGNCLKAYDDATVLREEWYGRKPVESVEMGR